MPRPVPRALRTAARRFAGIRLELALALGRDPTDAEVWAAFRRWDVRGAERALRLAMHRDRGPRRSEDDAAPSAVAAVLDPGARDGEVMETAARVIAEARQEEPEPVDLGVRLRRRRPNGSG